MSARSLRLSRRQAIGLLGMGSGLGLLSSARSFELRAAPLAQGTAARKISFPSGAVIRTIFKDIPADQVSGDILFHEHLDGVYDRTKRNLQLPPPSSADITPVVGLVKDAMKNGITMIVDGGHADMGVNYEHLREISRLTGLNVVASGGYYWQNTFPEEVSRWSEDAVTENLVNDAAAGHFGAYGEIGDLANAADFTADEYKVYRAVAGAQKRNGLPIFTHNNYGTGPNVPRDIALKQLDVFEKAGADPKHLVIGHMDSLEGANPDIIIAIAKRGAFVGIDRALGDDARDQNRLKLVMAFLEAGYVDNLLFSSDSRTDYLRVFRFVRQLRAAGVTDDILHQIMADNPRRFLAFVPKK